MAFSTMFFFSAVDSSTGYCDIDLESGEYQGEYCTLTDAMTKTYSLFFGTLEASDFDVPSPTLVTLFFFNVVVIIILLNIIIAVMSDAYAEVENEAELVFWDHRFELIQDVDSLTNCFTSLFGCSSKKKKSSDEEPSSKQEEESSAYKWFDRLLRSKKTSKLPKPILSMFTYAVMGLWMLVALLTFGLILPRHSRRKIFAPSVTDHLDEDDTDAVDVDRIKNENNMLREENSRLRKKIDALQPQLD